MKNHQVPSHHWRAQAAQIVTELFPVTAPEFWDDLLELRQGLLKGDDWNRILNQFLVCRHHLEADHYIPFYRLRRLVETSLKLMAIWEGQTNVSHAVPLRPIFHKAFRSIREIGESLRRDRFEHDLSFSTQDPLVLEITEVAPAS